MATSAEPRWLKVADLSGQILSVQRVEPFADLRAVINGEAARWAAQGWEVECPGAWGSLFVRRGSERRHVFLTPVEQPTPLHTSTGLGTRET